ncbi:hypothetical protein AR1Y2_2107 [Anaerostipes rhamnosivorans]|uniref:Uncharacterized protein n=1 Tax=Anaerostipes rhamnosivorans TaxID=1229621 RepID=A0A4P8IF97_9FIRM|nr:hypothetical protein AR1Y2_2107 [Anaerostipes rhamnosivorans]
MEDYGSPLFSFLLFQKPKSGLFIHNSFQNSKKGQGIAYSMKKLFSISNEIWYPII